MPPISHFMHSILVPSGFRYIRSVTCYQIPLLLDMVASPFLDADVDDGMVLRVGPLASLEFGKEEEKKKVADWPFPERRGSEWQMPTGLIWSDLVRDRMPAPHGSAPLATSSRTSFRQICSFLLSFRAFVNSPAPSHLHAGSHKPGVLTAVDSTWVAKNVGNPSTSRLAHAVEIGGRSPHCS